MPARLPDSWEFRDAQQDPRTRSGWSGRVASGVLCLAAVGAALVPLFVADGLDPAAAAVLPSREGGAIPWASPESRAPKAGPDLGRALQRAGILRARDDASRVAPAAPGHVPRLWPVAGGAAAVSSTFSVRRAHPVLGGHRPHEGIDLVAADGTPVVAAAAGVVVRVGAEPSAGRFIVIDHGGGYRTRYLHLAEVVVGPGQPVRGGDEIGRVGHSGLATGPHLHYEILVDGDAVNPRPYLREASAPSS